MKPILVIGGSDQAEVVLDLLAATHTHRPVGILDDQLPTGTTKSGYKVLGAIKDIARVVTTLKVTAAAIAIGDNWNRFKIHRYLFTTVPQLVFPTLIHPSAYVSPSVTTKEGSVILASAIVATGSSIGRFCLLNTQASVDHHNTIADFVSLAPHAVTGGRVTIGKRSFLGINSTVIHNIAIGADTIVGAGSVVTENITDKVVAFGNPAKVTKPRRPSQPYL